jgi:hypothetical protein
VLIGAVGLVGTLILNPEGIAGSALRKRRAAARAVGPPTPTPAAGAPAAAGEQAGSTQVTVS